MNSPSAEINNNNMSTPRRSAAARACFMLLILALITTVVNAYSDIRVPTGQVAEGIPVRWDLSNASARPNIQNRRILYYVDDAGTVDASGFLGSIDEFDAVQTAFNNWRNITESELDFESAGSLLNATTDAQDNRNVIRWEDTSVQSNVFAVTITTFDVASAQIVDADIELNDRDFTWDTLGAGTQGVPGRAYIENVLTHEIGHFVGLDHVGNAQSSLFFASTSGAIDQSILKHDDKAAIIRDYSHPTIIDTDLATVSGSVDDGTNAVFGAEIVFINARTLNVITTVLTEGPNGPFTHGDYEVANIPPADYLVFAQRVNTSNLGSYYGGAYTSFSPIIRGVAVGSVGVPSYVSVAPGATVTGIDITLPATQDPFEPDNTFGTATVISSGEVAVSNISGTTDSDFFEFSATVGQVVSIRVIADALGSPLNPVITVYDTDGSTVLISPVFGNAAYQSSANDIDEVGFDLNGVNFDSFATFTAPSTGTFFFEVASRVGLT
ncbi:MAG: matrixin family metalloprotease [Planctomycetes bacterium]|nr:matrixin family metalloprotease [Planctomycetota bacterium]